MADMYLYSLGEFYTQTELLQTQFY